MNAEQHEYLELMRKQAGGELSADAVLGDAKNPNSPLHTEFEWNDETAAAAYRLDQARKVIRLHVQVMTQAQVSTRVRIRPDTTGERQGEAGFMKSRADERGQIVNAARQAALARVEANKALQRERAWEDHMMLLLGEVKDDVERTSDAAAIAGMYVRGAPIDALVGDGWTRGDVSDLVNRYGISRADGWSAERASLAWREAARDSHDECWGFPVYEVPGGRPPPPSTATASERAIMVQAQTPPAPLPTDREVVIEQITWNEVGKWALSQHIKQGDHRTYQDVMTTINARRAQLGLPLWEARIPLNGGNKLVRGTLPAGLTVVPAAA
jgi:hypothetical protein